MASRPSTQPEVEADLTPEAIAELERRCDEIDNGSARTVGLSDALARARARRDRTER